MDASNTSARLGFIAQEVLPYLPEAVTVPEDPDSMLGVSTTEMIPVLINAVKELKAELDEAKARIATLEGTSA